MDIIELFLVIFSVVYSSAQDDDSPKDISSINAKVVATQGKRDGDHLFHLDMMISPEEERKYFGSKARKSGPQNAAINLQELLWTVPIPYDISNNDQNWEARFSIEDAMREYAEKTCITFRPKQPTDTDYISFVKKSGCWSYVGRIGGRQELSLDDGCYSKRIVIHEIMHAVGFLHEQSRPDRDNYVEILYGNIIPGQEPQFKKASTAFTHDLGIPYDYVSVMHYGRKAFSKNTLDTIRAPNKPWQQIGQVKSNGGLTASDIQQLNRLYKCGAVCFPNCANGRCVSTKLCVCNPGWIGLLCSIAICNPSCVHGRCTSPNQCKCDPGWHGEDCNTEEEHVHCFPPDAYVRNEKGSIIHMEDLQIGEKVLTVDKEGKHLFSEIIMMLHQNENEIASDYIKFSTTDGASLTLTSHHLIPVSKSEFIFAKNVRVNENITIYDVVNQQFRMSQVTAIRYVTKTGVYAPLTMEGTMMVNDIHVSCYASFHSHDISHMVFSPWRFLYYWLPSKMLPWSNTEDGVHWYPAAIKYGINFVGLLTF